jgi:hypothetical protein
MGARAGLRKLKRDIGKLRLMIEDYKTQVPAWPDGKLVTRDEAIEAEYARRRRADAIILGGRR